MGIERRLGIDHDVAEGDLAGEQQLVMSISGMVSPLRIARRERAWWAGSPSLRSKCGLAQRQLAQPPVCTDCSIATTISSAL